MGSEDEEGRETDLSWGSGLCRHCRASGLRATSSPLLTGFIRNHTKLPGHSKCLKALRVGRANSGTPVGVIRLLKKSGHTQSH